MHLNFDELQEHVYGDRRFDHVELCADCRARIQELERERELFQAWGRKLSSDVPAIRFARPRRRLWWGGAAAAAAAALIVFVSWPENPPGVIRVNPQSTVTVRPDSDVVVESERRVVVNRGHALFQVSGPFEVKTAAAILRVLGTTFEVTVDSKGTRVLVLEGKVQVIGAQGTVEASQDQMVYVEANSTPSEPVPVEPPVQDHQSSENLYRKAVDLEKKNLDEAIRYYAKALDRAQKTKDVEYIIRAGFHLGRCHELKLQEREAMNAYALVSSQKSDKDDLRWLINRAHELCERRGVQMYLDQFARTVKELRATDQLRLVPKEEEKTWASIASKGPRACYGLIQALDSSEPQVVTLIANRLKTLIDAQGIATLIEKLASKPHRDGASTALREILLQFNRARDLDAAADQAEFELSYIGPGQSREFGKKVDEIQDEMKRATVKKLREQADALRWNLPKSLAVPEILKALRKIILDPTIDETTRSEALMVLTSFDSISKADIDTILTALDDPHPRVRQAAAGSAHRDHRLLSKLLQRLRDDADLVRQQCAMSLGRIEAASSIPALLAALQDPSHHVRLAAHASLLKIIEPIKQIRAFEIPYRPHAPAVERAKDIQKWADWWSQTRGTDVLMARFDVMVRQWTPYHPNDLYDGLERKLAAKSRFSSNPVKEQERAEAARSRFEALKEFYLRDLAQVATPELLMPYLSGRVPGRDDPYWAVQLFVAECLASVLKDSKDIRDVVRRFKPQTPEVRAGCIYVLAFRESTADDRDALENALQDGDARIRFAACFALGRAGDPRSAAHLLPRLFAEHRTDVQSAAARAIGRIASRHPSLFQDAEFARQFAEGPAREEICYAFGEAPHPNALPFLRRLRVDADERVRFAAGWALARVGGGDLLWDMYRRAESYVDREGAVLAIGDVKDESKAPLLCESLTTERNQRVRAAILDALGRIGVRTRQVRDALLSGLEDEADEVRRAAWSALNALCGGKLPKDNVQEFLKVEGARYFE
jgi:HEAT repeat protein